jgi:ankyrin repeat protein
VDAVKRGDEALVRTLLAGPAGVNDAEADGTTALHYAVLADNLPVVRLLLQHGADASAANRYGMTPLQGAATNGSGQAAELLLEAGADANAVLAEGESVLMTAARTGGVDVINRLLDYGADISARERWYGETALIWAAAENHGAAVRALIERGADVNARSNALTGRRQGAQRGSWTPLMDAARQGALESVRVLIDEGQARLDDVDPDGSTALQLAILNAHRDVAAALIERGADKNLPDRTGMAALYAAIDMALLPAPFGRPDPSPTGPPDAMGLLRMLLDYGADPNARLHSPIIQRLHTSTDETLGEGATPFMRAAKSASLPILHLLLDYGASPALTEANHTTALMMAAGLGWRDGYPIRAPFVAIRDRGTERDAVEAMKLCLQLGADVNAANDRGETALHAAAEGRGSPVLIRFLVEAGARMDAVNRAHQTPYDAALAHRDRGGTLLRGDAVNELERLEQHPRSSQ